MPAKKDDVIFVAHLRGQVTESGASTYTEKVLSTNINPLGNQAIAIHSITTNITDPQAVAASDGISMALLKQSNNAMPELDDEDVIYKRTLILNVVTTGGSMFETVQTRNYDPPEIVADAELVMAVQGLSIANAETCSFDIRYSPITLTDAQFVKLYKA